MIPDNFHVVVFTVFNRSFLSRSAASTYFAISGSFQESDTLYDEQNSGATDSVIIKI